MTHMALHASAPLTLAQTEDSGSNTYDTNCTPLRKEKREKKLYSPKLSMSTSHLYFYGIMYINQQG